MSAPRAAPSTRVTGLSTPVEVSLCTHAYVSMSALAAGTAEVPGGPEITSASSNPGGLPPRSRDLCPELSGPGELRRAVNEVEGRGIPERPRPAVTEDHLVTIGGGEELQKK